MAIIGRKLTTAEDGIPGYLAHPDEPGKYPAVVFVHHANGVTAELKIYAAQLAQLGYVAVVPSIFEMLGVEAKTHIGKGVALQKETSDTEFLRVIDKAWQYMVGRADVDTKRSGMIAYCMGGRLAIPFAADTPQMRAMVLYYPSILDEPVSEMRPRHAFDVAKTLKCASMVIYGGRDYFSTPPIQRKVWESFVANGQPLDWHFFSYGNHGFASPDTDGYQPELAHRIWPMVTDFLDHELKGPGSAAAPVPVLHRPMA